ncbi:LysR family transcriptional regulator [Aliigemmobacter aestuarii]|uniref:LysR family transcriptional regulator n=1 Tax=Aliigemmobacter aestuarii TaxID=1445661 RepID=A0A4S3MQW1_9RHOB|nr:LysR substrate-binding domain-containing protein [Gemmobacter aestuarii]THD83791.1 LysR family transcriptional regulator [Gemmobacter aestuarii]
MSIPIRQLEAFHATCRKGSITRAAEYLGISQPAVSRLLSSLAESVGFELFHRSAGQLQPTAESAILLREVERLLDNLETIDRLSHDLTDRRAGHLRIACLPGFAVSHLPKVLADFLAGRPKLRVTLEPDRPERILEWIIREHYDCGISDEYSTHPAIRVRMVGMRTVCILPKGHALSARHEIRPEDIVNENIIHTRRDSGFFHQLRDVFSARGLKLGSRIETRQFTAACMLVAAGAGVAVVSEMDAREYESRGLVLRPFLPETPHYLSLIRPPTARSSLLASEFMEMFEDSLAPFRVS